MAKRKTHFEQVPIELALQIAQQEARKAETRTVSCAICKTPVALEKCKVDEDGEPVHDECYFVKLGTDRRPQAG